MPFQGLFTPCLERLYPYLLGQKHQRHWHHWSRRSSRCWSARNASSSVWVSGFTSHDYTCKQRYTNWKSSLSASWQCPFLMSHICFLTCLFLQRCRVFLGRHQQTSAGWSLRHCQTKSLCTLFPRRIINPNSTSTTSSCTRCLGKAALAR